MTTKSDKVKVNSSGTTPDSPLEVPVAPEVPAVGDGQEDNSQARMQQFREGYEKLVKETDIAVQCLITPTGPSANMVDLKKEPDEAPQQ